MSDELIYVDQVLNLGGDAGPIFSINTGEMDDETMTKNAALMQNCELSVSINGIEHLDELEKEEKKEASCCGKKDCCGEHKEKCDEK